jgi:hypothetical protein
VSKFVVISLYCMRMDNRTYESAWTAVEPVIDQYFNDAAALKNRDIPPTQTEYSRLHAEFVAQRDAAVTPFGVTYEALTEENYRRVSEFEVN